MQPLQHSRETPAVSNDLMLEMNSLSRRLRLIEERSANLRKKVQLLEQNMLSQSKRVSTDVKTALAEISELRQRFSDFNDKATEVLQSLEDVARKSDITRIEHYLSLWKPVNFVTQNEIGDIVKSVVKNMHKSKAEQKD